jgi:hypothetical protein
MLTRFALPLIVMSLSVGCLNEDIVTGAAAKGPMLTGSSIDVSTVDANGNPRGQVFSTATETDRGEFTLAMNYRGFIALEAEGFYYNEATGQLSTAPITLRGFAEVTQNDQGAPSAFVNVITHLTNDRIKNLTGQGPLAEAVSQAESEMRAELGIGPNGFDPGVPGAQISLIGGDTPAAAYLFAVSTVLSQAAALRPGTSVDANLQEVINTIDLDLAPDGVLDQEIKDELAHAATTIDVEAVVAAFEERLKETGTDAEAPRLAAMIAGAEEGTGLVGEEPPEECPTIDGSVTLVSSGDVTALAGVCSITGSLVVNLADESADLSALRDLRSIGFNLVIDGVQGTNLGVTEASFPALTTVGGTVTVTHNPTVTAFQAPLLERVGGLFFNSQGITDVALPSLTTIGSAGDMNFLGGDALVSINLPLLTTITGGIEVGGTTSLLSLQLPALTLISENLVIYGHLVLPSLDLPALASIGNGLTVAENASLREIDTPLLSSVTGPIRIFGNPVLADCSGTAVTDNGECLRMGCSSKCDCDAGEICNEGLCTAPPSTCTSSFYCPRGEGDQCELSTCDEVTHQCVVE